MRGSDILQSLFSFLGGVLISAGLFIVVFLFLRRRLTDDLNSLTNAVERFSNGERIPRLRLKSEIFSRLVSALNEAVETIAKKIRVIERQRNELDSVLENLHPGIVIIDEEGIVLRINKSAASLLGLLPPQSIGRSIEEVLRNIQLQEFVKRAIVGVQPIESEIIFYSEQEKNIHI